MAVEAHIVTAPVETTAAGAAADDDPLWYKDAIIYQAHVKSFFDSNNDGIGDFQGLTQKLDYLQALGITCLWLLPFFPSPLKDDGYDIADYLNVHPSYGTLDDFKAFVQTAHERRIKVLIELVVNHTSDQHPWFERARRAPQGSDERAFYVWSDTDKKFPETRIIFTDTEKSNWTYDSVAGQYYWHRFFSHQPDLNHNNPAVVDAVIDVMKFWLDLGVDALRLDAVPYLCVREGTINENLPETHDVLKRIRRELDAAYKNRMLLAEANQWPSDVRAYFGDGDECHMAFHFPLMPRMFMALRQEDRHAITEILNQTPEIPENCQWALFLRNHDELTLEMVTDEERDYMYSAYASEPQMRLNVGIRRRLAPLLENSRRRIELLTSMLFSMPGTPIVYYGDEIGMGDNIYLGDRNGVRTPMQWTGDRNAGFSRADPARLYAPPIMDPVYGYPSINVEAQERYSFSLLNWMKRLIAMRKQHRVLGRGSIEFVACSNRKVLAFLRRDARETILLVDNLSRNVQPVELDLKAFAGLVPIEMWGLTEFPRITDQPFVLTLGPYASYWFALEREPRQMAPRAAPSTDPNAAIVESLPALMVGPDWQTLLSGGTRQVLERTALTPFLLRQRWFASKARLVRQTRFLDWSLLRGDEYPAFLAMLLVDYADGWREAYVLPLALRGGADAEQILKQNPSAVLARITGARKGVIVDGGCDDQTCDELFNLVTAGRQLATRYANVRGVAVAGAQSFGPSNGDSGTRTWIRPSSDQSNSVAFAEDRFVLKLFRRIEPTINPEYEIGRFLTERGFSRIPPLAGALEYRAPGVDVGTLAVVEAAIKHQGTGWDHALGDLGRYYERVGARVSQTNVSAESQESIETAVPAVPGTDGLSPRFEAEDQQEPPPFFEALEHWYLIGAQTLGKRTAELHLALSGVQNPAGAGPIDPAFSPERFDRPALGRLADEMKDRARDSLDLLERRRESLGDAARAQAEEVLSKRPSIVARFDELGSLETGGLRIRVHGDYHLGQVLRTEEDFVIIDFEGEPARSIAERRAKQTPLKDVAGMVRSFSYAAHAALLAFTVHAPDEYSRLESWAEAWQHWASAAFLKGYTSTLAGTELLPDACSCATLLRASTLEKVLYELSYELNNRPDWARIPLVGLLRLIR